MTQQEYEQQKRECWEEFKVLNSTTLETTKQAFDWIWNRAYTLGKQTETISQEEIEKAALDYIRTNPFVNSRTATTARESFVDGANFTLGKQEKDAGTVIQGWVARDFDGDVFLYQNEPDRDEIAWNGYMMHSLPVDSFPDLTWDDDPIEVELTIKRKNNG